MKWFEIRDPVYGFIEFNEWEKKIIDHPVFQRLRRIRQVGLTSMIYPGTMHTRFEHSLGVMHLATKMFDNIVKIDENKRLLKDELGYGEGVFERDRQLIRIAALLHDVGHAPFSHASEELFPLNPQTNKHFKHEDYTAAIIKGPLREVIEDNNYNITADEVSDLIEGNPKKLRKRVFWKLLISSQLDADRGDYLLRDSLHCGVKYGVYDVERLLVTLALGKDPESEDIILGVKEGGWHVAESLIIARYQMFTQVYYHKTRRAYDYMLKEALKETIGEYPSPTEIDEFMKYDDYVMWNIMEEKSEWFRKIINREHIRMVLQTKETPDDKEKWQIESYKKVLDDNNIWYWEDVPDEAKSWYKLDDSEEIMIISSDGKIYPLSHYSIIVKSLQKQFARSRLYVMKGDKEKVEKLKENMEVISP